MTPSISLTKTRDAKAMAAIEEGLSRYNDEQAGNERAHEEFGQVFHRET